LAVNDIVIVVDVKDDLAGAGEFFRRGRRRGDIRGVMTGREFAGGYSKREQNLIECRGWLERGDKYAGGQGPDLGTH
jgi:hypothetical protein